MPIPDDERVNSGRLNDQRLDASRVVDQQITDQSIGGPPIDEKFEAHLKQFRPLSPQPLPNENRVHAPRSWFVRAAWTVAAAAVVAVAMFALHGRGGRVAPAVETFALAHQPAESQSLTISSANALLATAPSFKDAIDGMAFPPKPAPLPADKHSALAELSKEKIKL